MAQQKIFMEYKGEWEISTPALPISFKNIVTPAFSPLPDNGVKFSFEAWYQRVDPKSSRNYIYLFKLKLVKLSSVHVSPTLEVTYNVNVKYCDGTLFNEYPILPSEKVDNINEVTFVDVVQEMYTDGYFSTHYAKMNDKPLLIINCKMTFYDQNLTSHFSPGMERLSSNKNLDLLRNFKTMYDPELFSDFVFDVGDKSFPAHKFILAAHSPVFKNMLTHEFLESENNRVTLTDTTPEIFETFLKYLYSGEIEDKSWDSLKALYYLADKYDVGILKNECTDAISPLLSVELACEILQLAYSYSDAGLKAAAINYSVNNIKEIVLREDWKELVETNLKIGYDVTVNFLPK